MQCRYLCKHHGNVSLYILFKRLLQPIERPIEMHKMHIGLLLRQCRAVCLQTLQCWLLCNSNGAFRLQILLCWLLSQLIRTISLHNMRCWLLCILDGSLCMHILLYWLLWRDKLFQLYSQAMQFWKIFFNYGDIQ